MNTITGRLTQVTRLNGSYYGNPRFELTVDGETYRTGIDCAVAYEVTNYKIGRDVTITLKGSRNSVIDMAYEDGSKA